MMFADIPVLLGNVTAGKLGRSPSGSAKRARARPTYADDGRLGMPQVLANNWYGLVAPGGLPAADVAARISSAAVEALNSTGSRTSSPFRGATTVGSTGEQFSAHVKAEMEKMGAGRQSGGRQAAVICMRPARSLRDLVGAYARARSLRTLCSSTGRSGIEIRKRGADGAFDQMDVAAMGADQFGGDRQPSPLPPGRPEVWNASNRCSRAFAGTPGPVSETSMIATEPSRRPVMRICKVAASPLAAFQRLRRHCAPG